MANSPRNNGNFLVNLVRGSIILTALDRFTAYIYTLLKTGFIGWIFTGYRSEQDSRLIRWLSGTRSAKWLGRRRRSLCRRIEGSVLLNFVPYAMRFFLGCRLRVYGAFLASFGLYTAVVTAVSAILSGQLENLLEHSYILVSVVMIFASLPLILSKTTLADAIPASSLGRLLLKITGWSESDLRNTVGSGGHMNTAFLIGIICGALTYRFSPVYILLGIAAFVWAYLVLIRPEIGVITLFAAMPWFPTMLLAAVVAYTAVCWIIKLIRGKRIFRIEPVDLMAAAFTVMLFSGGVISLSPSSLKPALLMVCLILGYFVTVGLIQSREWLTRCAAASVISATLESLWGIFLYFTGGGYSSKAWLDDEMFTSIGGRAVGTLDNPNMLGEYLILIIPVAVSMFIGRGEGLRKLSSFLCIGIMGACLVLTWSRGAWLGLIFAALLFLFMWHRRSMWLVLLGIASIPVLPSILPASIVSRFTSIGNMADSSTSYRMYIWRASVNMIADNPLSGIGIGEGAWDRLYPLYTYMGVEAAPHSHNLYLQIWLELGLIGILTFVCFLFLLYQSGFTMFSKISGNTALRTPDISRTMLAKNLENGTGDADTEMQRGRTQLRISAAGPLCGIAALLVQGMTDYAWYNYRLYLMFWLMCGLASAYIRSGQSMVGDNTAMHGDSTVSDTTILLDGKTAGKTKQKKSAKKAESAETIPDPAPETPRRNDNPFNIQKKERKNK
ncbi:MAG: O-antigen ligase family protein [Clostridia bacterium]|nr:O-antigen ligase family protein [Clostridia bacterium]